MPAPVYVHQHQCTFNQTAQERPINCGLHLYCATNLSRAEVAVWRQRERRWAGCGDFWPTHTKHSTTHSSHTTHSTQSNTQHTTHTTQHNTHHRTVHTTTTHSTTQRTAHSTHEIHQIATSANIFTHACIFHAYSNIFTHAQKRTHARTHVGDMLGFDLN